MDEETVKLISDVVILVQLDNTFIDICLVRCFHGGRVVI